MTDSSDKPVVISVGSFAELLATLPNTLGVVPTNSLVVTCTDENHEHVMTCSIGTDQTLEQVQDMFTAIANTDAVRSIFPVIIEDDGAVLEKWCDILRDEGVEKWICAPYIGENMPFIIFPSKDVGYQVDWKSSHLAAVSVMQGRIVFESKDELDRLFEPIEPAVTPIRYGSGDPLSTRIFKIYDAVENGLDIDPAVLPGIITHSDEAEYLLINVASTKPAKYLPHFIKACKVLRGEARVNMLVFTAVVAYMASEGVIVLTALNEAKITGQMMEPEYLPQAIDSMYAAYHNCTSVKEFREVILAPEFLKGDKS